MAAMEEIYCFGKWRLVRRSTLDFVFFVLPWLVMIGLGLLGSWMESRPCPE